MMPPQNETAPFVDLYDLLDLPPGSDVATTRKRITTLYIEAQNNLDHRNFRKRFYYQELFETYLPQAHHLLLNDARRAEYHKQLQAHHAHASGTELRFDKPSPETQLEVAQDALESGTLPTLNPVAPPKPAPSVPPTPRPAAPEWMRMDAGRVERRRDFKRRELIQRELENAGLRWGVAAGVAVVFFISALLYLTLNPSPGEALQPLGLPWGVFGFLYFAAMISLGVFCARIAARYARRRIVAALSQMPYEQLLHRCERG
jgi:hypothetical protein